MAIQDIKIGIDCFFSTCKSYCRLSTVPCKSQAMAHQLLTYFLLKLVKSVHLVIQTFPSISDFHKTNNLLVVID